MHPDHQPDVDIWGQIDYCKRYYSLLLLHKNQDIESCLLNYFDIATVSKSQLMKFILADLIFCEYLALPGSQFGIKLVGLFRNVHHR